MLCIFLLMSGQLSAQQIVTDRPDQTESSSTVGDRNLQIETGLLMGFEGEEPNSTRQLLLPTTLFRYGILETVELRLVSQFENIKIGKETINGISDLEVGVKVELFNAEESSTEVAILTHLILPIGAAELTNDKFGVINKLSISHELSDRIGLGYNLGYDYFGNGNGDLTYSLALGVGVNDKVGVYLEPYGALANFETFVLNFDAGFTYLVNDNFQLDFSFGTGVTDRMNYMAVGFSWLILKE